MRTSLRSWVRTLSLPILIVTFLLLSHGALRRHQYLYQRDALAEADPWDDFDGLYEYFARDAEPGRYHTRRDADPGRYHTRRDAEPGRYHTRRDAEPGRYHTRRDAEPGRYHTRRDAEPGRYHTRRDAIPEPTTPPRAFKDHDDILVKRDADPLDDIEPPDDISPKETDASAQVNGNPTEKTGKLGETQSMLSYSYLLP